jgi:hypothetical protein
MNKRLLKRHKRQVARARERVRLSEPDLRTPEQLKAAREARHTAAGRPNGPPTHYPTPSTRNQGSPAAASMAKVEEAS